MVAVASCLPRWALGNRSRSWLTGMSVSVVTLITIFPPPKKRDPPCLWLLRVSSSQWSKAGQALLTCQGFGLLESPHLAAEVFQVNVHVDDATVAIDDVVTAQGLKAPRPFRTASEDFLI